MKIIDCSACIGYASVNRLIINHENYPVYEKVRQPKNAEELLEEMDYNGIDEAIVCNTTMLDSGILHGNEEFLANKENYTGRLHGTIVIEPSFLHDSFLPENLFQTICKNNLFGVRANPKRNRYMFDKITIGDIADMLIEKNIPVYISPDDGWENVFAIMKEFPELTAIVSNYGLWGSDGYVYPLVKTYKNLYFDTSDFQEIVGIETFVKRFGSEKLLFGTNYPKDNMGGPLAVIYGANISSQDKENIFHGNIERLMNGRKLK